MLDWLQLYNMEIIFIKFILLVCFYFRFNCKALPRYHWLNWLDLCFYSRGNNLVMQMMYFALPSSLLLKSSHSLIPVQTECPRLDLHTFFTHRSIFFLLSTPLPGNLSLHPKARHSNFSGCSALHSSKRHFSLSSWVTSLGQRSAAAWMTPDFEMVKEPSTFDVTKSTNATQAKNNFMIWQ